MLVLDECIDFQNYSATSNDIKLVHWPLTGGYGIVGFNDYCYIGTARRGLRGAAGRPGPSSLYQM